MPRPPYIKVGAEDAISPRGSVFASSTLREQQGNSRGKTPLLANAPLTADAHPNSARSTLFDRGWQQPLDHNEAQPVHRVKDAEGTAKPLVLDSARWLGYLPAESVRTFHAQKATNKQTIKAAPDRVGQLTAIHQPTPPPFRQTITRIPGRSGAQVTLTSLNRARSMPYWRQILSCVSPG